VISLEISGEPKSSTGVVITNKAARHRVVGKKDNLVTEEGLKPQLLSFNCDIICKHTMHTISMYVVLEQGTNHFLTYRLEFLSTSNHLNIELGICYKQVRGR